MAYVPVQILKCVVFIGYLNKDGKEKFGGSAFWVSRAGPQDVKDQYRPAYLVTAGHVIRDMKADMASNDTRVRIRVNLVNGGQQWVDTPFRFWEEHPDYPKVDLAVLKIGIDNQLWDHVAWPLELLVENDKVDGEHSDRQIELGDELFFAGLFWPHKGVSKNIPIVRVGNVASLREEPVTNRDGQPMDAYLVESRSIGGLSGSPVFLDLFAAKQSKPPKAGYMAGAHQHDSPSRFRLFGIVHGHFDWNDREPDGVDSSQRKLGVNMGIAIVIPAERIVSMLEVFNEEEKSEAEEARKRQIVFVGDDTRPRANVTFQTVQGFDAEKVEKKEKQ